MNNKCIIEKIQGSNPLLNNHIAMQTREIHAPPTFYFRNIETGDLYSHIAAALAWPGKGTPGFACIIAVEKSDDLHPKFHVLEEIQGTSVDALINNCRILRQKYRPEGYSDLLRVWWGDSERFYSFVTNLNTRSSKETNVQDQFFVTPPYDIDRSNHFEIYIRRIQSCLTPNEHGVKRLYLGSCNVLRNALQNMPSDAATMWSDDDSPPIAALGYCVHSLLAYQSWKHNIDYSLINWDYRYKLISTIGENFAPDPYDPWGDGYVLVKHEDSDTKDIKETI
jgi:hypothetical protein